MEHDERGMAAWQAFWQTYTTVIPALECDLREAQDLPLVWYNVLTQLNRNPTGGLRLQELAGAIALSQSGLTRLLDRMSKAGLIERQPCPHDRRGAYAVITSQGKARLEQAVPTYSQGIEQHFLRPLSAEDIQALNRVLSKILEVA